MLDSKNYSQPIWSVTQLTNYLKEVVDTDPNLQQAIIKGEISNFHHHSSGHMYFTLKDKNSQLSAVMFKSSNQRLDFKLEEGMAVIAQGRLGIYAVRGQYQIYIDKLQPDGIGSLHIAFEQLKEKLSKEGLFADEWKKSIPQIPSKVGVVTSSTGAAIHDIISVVKRRFSNVSLLIAPTTVQGKNAASSIVKALEYIKRSNVDVIIIGRGGGSIEDLWAFNMEEVARAIFDSEIPIISAVGHETDFTIADFVADVRAPTPSAAAEIVVSNREEIKKYLNRLASSLEQAINNKLQQSNERLKYLIRRRSFKLVKEKIREYIQQVDELKESLETGLNQDLNQKQEKLESLVSQLNSLYPLNIFERGYSLTRKKNNQQEINSISQVENQELIEVILKDGKLICKINEIIE